MKLLLDTHVWLWSFLEPDRLSSRSRRELQRPRNELWLSPVSSWEAAMLVSRRRLSLLPDASTWVQRAFERVPMHTAELTHEVATLSVELEDLSVADPVDRFLAASCLVHKLTLVTADHHLRSYRRVKTLW